MARPLLLVLLVALLGTSESATAQTPDTSVVELPPLTVEAARTALGPADAPVALAQLRRPEAQRLGTPSLSLEAVLRPLPGLYIQDRSHLALGERVVIRGFGSRAAFGVRGVQVVLDGVPLALPDGQAVLDVVDPLFVTEAELIRGPSSVLWGNASGGVLALSSWRAPDPARGVTGGVRTVAGSYGLRHWSGHAAVPTTGGGLLVRAAHLEQDGYRRHSAGRFTRAIGHLQLRTGATAWAVRGAVAHQDVQHPGALTAEQQAADPRQADDRFAGADAGKTSTQAQIGVTAQRLVGAVLGRLTAYGLLRDLQNPLPFAYIDLDRRVAGARLDASGTVQRLEWSVGLDAAWQADDRVNRNTVDGEPGPRLDLDQHETVRTLGVFALAQLPLSARAVASVGVRGDAVAFELDDALLEDGDASGARTLRALSPLAGITYRLGGTLLFASISTAFETPTTTELVNNPTLSNGFNPDLAPQLARSLEVGARGRMGADMLRYDVALFTTRLLDRISAFQLEDGDGRTFYRNGGTGRHTGVEVALDAHPRPWLRARLTGTLGRYRFDDDALSGTVPGLPSRRLFASVSLGRSDGLWGRVEVQAVGPQYVADDNAAQADGYAVVDLHAGWRGTLGGVHVQPFLRLANVLDATYAGSVIVNARGGRYYEPAPGRTVQVGLALTY